MKSKIGGLINYLDVSIEGFETKFQALFVKVDLRWGAMESMPSRGKTKVRPKGSGELKRLACSINYDGRGSNGGSDRSHQDGGVLLLDQFSLKSSHGT